MSNVNLRKMSMWKDAGQIMNLDPKMLWMVDIAAMDVMSFSMMRFFCRDMSEFVNLVVLADMKAIKQVHATMSIRRAMQEAARPQTIKCVFDGSHHGTHLVEKWNPECKVLVDLYEHMIDKARIYLTMIINSHNMNRTADLGSPPVRSPTHDCTEEWCSIDYRKQMIRSIQDTCNITMPAKSWQRSATEQDTMMLNFSSMDIESKCKLNREM